MCTLFRSCFFPYIPETTWQSKRDHYLQAAAGAVLGDDADVGGVDASADEPGEMVELNVSHLKASTQTHRGPSAQRSERHIPRPRG